MKKNEFVRNKPELGNGLAFSVMHKLIPLLFCFFSIWYSTQYCAKQLNYDVYYIGQPWFFFFEKPFYYPFLLPILIIKHIGAGDPYVGNALGKSSHILLFSIFFSIFLYFLLSFLRSVVSPNNPVFGTSRWGTKKDLKENGLLEPHGVVLGQLSNADVRYSIKDGAVKLKLKKASQYIRHSGKTSTIFFAPSRSGKGVSSVIPTLEDFPDSMIIFDPKGENWNITAGWRSTFSYVWRFSPVSEDTLCFNILDEIEERFAFRDASTIAQILTAPADGTQKGDPHWTDTANDLLIGVILHVKCSDYPEKNMYGVLRFMSSVSDDDKGGTEFLNEMIRATHCNEDIHNTIVDIAGRALKKPEEERGSVISSAVTALRIFQDPLVQKATRKSDFCLMDFQKTDKPISLYLTVPFSDIDRLAPLMRLLISFILRKFSQGETQFGEIKLSFPILFLIDEFPTLGAFPVLETMMGILAGYGITFFLICQSMTQIIKLYGENNPILDHCRVMCTYAMSDYKSAKLFSDMIGIETVKHSNDSSSGNKFDWGMTNVSVNTQTVQRNLMNADEIQHLPANLMLIFAHGMPVYIAKKNVYYSDPFYSKRLETCKSLIPKSRKELLKETQKSVRIKPEDKHWYDVPVTEYYPIYDSETTVPVNVFSHTVKTIELDDDSAVELTGAMI